MSGQNGVVSMGYQSVLFIGTAGSAATNQVTNIVDLDYSLEPSMGETIVRGDGSSVPVETEKTASIKPEIKFKMLNRPADTLLAQLAAAAAVGSGVAAKYKSSTSGKGYDGDVNVKMENTGPIKGEAAFQFTLTANDQYGRDPQLWVV